MPGTREILEFTGVVVADPASSAMESDGLYLRTNDNRWIKLSHHTGQASVDSMWRMSRWIFEKYLNKNVTIKGYFSDDVFMTFELSGQDCSPYH